MATEKRITTNVVAYTSFLLGHVTRPISLRTSARKRRERPHHPVTLSRARPPNESSWSAAAVFIVYLAGVPCTPASSLRCARTSLLSPLAPIIYSAPNWQRSEEH